MAQSSPSNQTLIVVDSEDRFIRYASRVECHIGDGLMHRGLVVVLSDASGRVLLQNRRNMIFDSLWDLTCATHTLHVHDKDETYEEAAARCLQVEWETKAHLRRVLKFAYFETCGEQCENEYCVVLAGRLRGEVTPNRAHCHFFRWVEWERLVREAAEQPSFFTPWARQTVRLMSEGKMEPSVRAT